MRLFLVPCLALLLAGCASTALTDRLTTVPPQSQVVDGDVEQVYFAAQKAFKRLDFVLVRSTMGRVEAASSIKTSETFGDSRQTVARLKIVLLEPGKSEVELTLTQTVSSSSMGGTRQEALREHGFFQTYFSMLQRVLQEQAADHTRDKN